MLLVIHQHLLPQQVGNHIDVVTGKWTALDAGIGAGVDSYYEYLLKGGILLGMPKLISNFEGVYLENGQLTYMYRSKHGSGSVLYCPHIFYLQTFKFYRYPEIIHRVNHDLQFVRFCLGVSLFHKF